MERLASEIGKRKHQPWFPKPSDIGEDVATHSCFKARTIRRTEHLRRGVHQPLENIDGTVVRCIKVAVVPTFEQKRILIRWFYAYAHMYNATIEYLRNARPKCISWKRIRTRNLKETRDTIVQESQIASIQRNTRVYVHTLDGAIKAACANWKTARALVRGGHAHLFRIRKWRIGRRQLVMDIEPQCFNSGTLCVRVFGDGMAFSYDGETFDVKTIEPECKMIYDRAFNSFTLLVPQTRDAPTPPAKFQEMIALDPGIRTFMTGVSENGALQLGDNIGSRLSKLFRKMDNATDKIQSKKRLRVALARCRRKISGIVDELHWKCATYLTDNFENVVIGDFSSKRTSRKSDSVLSNMTKRVAQALSFYKFRERLCAKCTETGRRFSVIDEHYTSKLCSKCGHFKADLGSAHVYECTECKMVIGRDFNGARNIFIRSEFK